MFSAHNPRLLVTALTQESPESPAIRSSFWMQSGGGLIQKKKDMSIIEHCCLGY